MRTHRMHHVLLVLAVTMTGCAFRTPTPTVPRAIAGDAPPPAHLQVTSIDVQARGGTVDEATTSAVRAQTAKILADAARKSCTGDGPATVHVTVTLGEYVDELASAVYHDGFAYLGWVVGAPAGLTYERQELGVEVTITRGGRTFTGHGQAEKEGSIYARARKRALAVALDRALADAATDRSARPACASTRRRRRSTGAAVEPPGALHEWQRK
jgi:hypothetical protein